MSLTFSRLCAPWVQSCCACWYCVPLFRRIRQLLKDEKKSSEKVLSCDRLFGFCRPKFFISCERSVPIPLRPAPFLFGSAQYPERTFSGLRARIRPFRSRRQVFLLMEAFAGRAAAKRSFGVWGDSLNKLKCVCMTHTLLAGTKQCAVSLVQNARTTDDVYHISVRKYPVINSYVAVYKEQTGASSRRCCSVIYRRSSGSFGKYSGLFDLRFH